jgi:pimeloyl-ACP methyl ester carboxylesterase
LPNLADSFKVVGMQLAPIPPLYRARSEAKATEPSPAAVRWFELHRLTAVLSWRVYQDQRQWISDPRTKSFADTDYGLLAHGRSFGDTAIVAFRGSIGLPPLAKNWRKANLRFGWVGDPRRHRGFQESWMRLRPNIVDWLKATQSSRIVLTGHSLGAALAEMAAFDLAGSHPIESVILYAPPMVGDNEFNESYAQSSVAGTDKTLGALTQRWLMLTDAISLPLPCLLGYARAKPINRVDQFGWHVQTVPSFAEQVGDYMLPGRVPPPPLVRTALPGYRLGERVFPGQSAMENPFADLRPPAVFEQMMILALRPIAIANGFMGLAAYTMLATIRVLARAIGFHSMKGYATAFDAPTNLEFWLDNFISTLPDEIG